ncbi:hypothetical protein CI610_03434 [invertebrate metagenome]|uniref:Uncharacterized protein n=1 Tax=invertebrate metagenome TaxID=1711999 RepID=A0A2H9T341_9ZZZZ
MRNVLFSTGTTVHCLHTYKLLLFTYRDPQSGLKYNDICLGRTTRDCYVSHNVWERYSFNTFIQHYFRLPDGIPVWVKVKAINHCQ